MNEELFSAYESLTYDDLLIVPGYSEKLPSEMDVRARLVGDIWLNIPIMSAAMDTVTEARMAIALAREGGIGIIHRNLSPEAQAREVDIVKRSESGMISDPIVLHPHAPLKEAEEIMGRFPISGIPSVEATSRKLVGILTNRDIRFCEPEDSGRPVTDFMTAEGLVTAPLGTTLEQARSILQKHRIEKLPLVDADGQIQGVITVQDIQKKSQYPQAAKDSRGRLLVGGAVGVGADLELRAGMMAEKGVDVLVVDTAHGHSAGVVKAIRRIKAVLPHMPVIGGNVVTEEGTLALIEAGADAVKVGVGRVQFAPRASFPGRHGADDRHLQVCKGTRPRNIPVIADGASSTAATSSSRLWLGPRR